MFSRIKEKLPCLQVLWRKFVSRYRVEAPQQSMPSIHQLALFPYQLQAFPNSREEASVNIYLNFKNMFEI